MNENKIVEKPEVEAVDTVVEEDREEDKGAIVGDNGLSRTITFGTVLTAPLTLLIFGRPLVPFRNFFRYVAA